jgi:glycosyltransferase involved in cell wall biosynthesis
MKKKNVLHLVEYLYLGGIERLLEQLAVNTNENANIHFFTYETEELKGIGKQIEESGFPVYTFKKSAGRDWNLIKLLIKVIKEQKVDVLHTHDFGPVEYAVILKMRFPYLKLIHTQHTIVNFIRHPKYTRFFQLASYFYKNIIAVSQFVADIFLEHCPLMKKRALVMIANGVDTNLFNKIPVKESGNVLKLVSISRISGEKNLTYLLRTCKFLKEANISFEFHHAGTSKLPELTKELHRYVEENNLSENVFFHGFTNDVPSILEKGDIFISASHTEGHPVSVLEAMASKRLCLCSDIKAHRELGDNVVVLFDKEQEKALFEKLLQLLVMRESFEVSNRLEIGSKKVENKFSIQMMVENYAGLYN